MSDTGDGECWRRLTELFDELVDLSAAARAARLAELGAGDPALRRDLERLLAEVGDVGPLDAPAVEAFSALLEQVDPPEPEEALGQRVGPYRIVEELGRGGMGVVYLAERADGQFEQRVALKLVKRGLDTDEVLERFRRERQILARLEHRAIARLYDGGATEDGRPYFAMELVTGEPITVYCNARGVSIEERLRLFRRVCEAVEHAHQHHVVHRDLKPSNILVTKEQDLKLLDFGVAKVLGSGEEGQHPPTLTRMGLRAMTPEYAAPEQVVGGPVSAATDVYALGVVLYELLTGRRPYRLAGRSGPEVERTILEVEPGRPSRVVAESVDDESLAAEEIARTRGLTPTALRRRLAGDLDAIVLTALRKAPARRYGSAQALAEDIERHLAGRPVEARPEGSLYRARKFARRQRVGVAGISLAAVTASLFLYLIGRRPAGDPETATPKLALGAIRRLTSLPGLESEPTWSQDGRFVAFSSSVSGNRDIWLQPTAGGEAIQLTYDPAEDAEAHWSPDGSTIVFGSRRGGGGLFTIPVTGGEAARLTDFGYRPRWSPDGGRVLFQLRMGQRLPNQIQVVDYPGGSPRRLLAVEAGGDSCYSADWSPDGGSVVCQSGGYVAGAGLFVQPLSPSVPGFFLEWEGRAISGVNPVWSRLGSGIIFARSAPGHFFGATHLEFAPLDARGHLAGPLSRLTTGSDHYPAVSRNGERLAYASEMSSNSDIWKVPLSLATGLPDGAPVRVTRGSAMEQAPAVLPDGRHLLFLSNRDDGWFLYASDLDGGNVQLVDRSHNWTQIDAISPDGRLLVLLGTELGGSPYRTYLLPFEPGALSAAGPARSLGDAFRRGTSFSPGGRYLLYGGRRPESAILAWEDPASSDPREVRWPLDAEFLAEYPVQFFPRFSPDGEWVAFGAAEAPDEPAVFVVRRGSDAPRLLWEGSSYPFWGTDPHRIYLWSERGDETGESLGCVDFDPATGAVGSFQPIDLRPTSGGYGEALEYWPTPDRRWLFFSWWDSEGDIYVADLVQG